MQAVILAGGQGTRLKPYTISFPKPLVPLGDKPILDILLTQLARSGVRDVILSTGHMSGLIETYCGNGSKWGLKTSVFKEDSPLGTAGALAFLDKLDDDFLVLNGDVLTDLHFGELFLAHKKSKASATIATCTRDSILDFGVTSTNEDGYLARYEEKPTTRYLVSMGVYVFSRNAVGAIAKGESIGMPDLFLRLKSQGQLVYCFESKSFWLDIGRMDDFEKAQEAWRMAPDRFL